MTIGHVPDQDLLLLTHQALSPWRRSVTQAHLKRCAQCQSRYALFIGTNQALATAIREPSDLPWKPPARPRQTFWHWPVLAVLTVVLIVLLGFWTINHHPHSTHPVSTSSGGCRPDLPNDRCR